MGRARKCWSFNRLVYSRVFIDIDINWGTAIQAMLKVFQEAGSWLIALYNWSYGAADNCIRISSAALIGLEGLWYTGLTFVETDKTRNSHHIHVNSFLHLDYQSPTTFQPPIQIDKISRCCRYLFCISRQPEYPVASHTPHKQHQRPGVSHTPHKRHPRPGACPVLEYPKILTHH